MRLSRRVRDLARRAYRALPSPLQRPFDDLRSSRSNRVRTRRIVGTDMQVIGANHTTADYDDAWLVSLIGGSSAFMDIGCNVGFFALATCALRPEAEVLAVDANPECAAVTAGNLVRNGFGERARAVSTFVSDRRGEITFNTIGLGAAGSGREGFATSAESARSSSTVLTTTVDELCRATDFAPDLIKIDVEGAEHEVLRGAMETVGRWQPRIMVEVHSGPDLPMARNTGDLLAWCDEVGYAAWYLAKHVALVEPDQVDDRGRFHALLLPAGTAYPDELRTIRQGDPISIVLS